MRKLLILMLVLGMASFATAMPVISVSNSSPVTGTTFQVYIDGTAAEASGPLGNPVGGYSGFLAVDYATYGPTGGSPYLTVNPVPAITTAAGGYAMYGPTMGLQWWMAAPLLPWAEVSDVDVGNWFTYTVTATGAPGTSEVIDLLNNAVGGIGQVTINIVDIPEPMTMALLGLGGLFLRRRK